MPQTVVNDLTSQGITSSSNVSMEATAQPRKWKVLLAFAILYFVWGSTFLAIRVGVREVPPFVAAALLGELRDFHAQSVSALPGSRCCI